MLLRTKPSLNMKTLEQSLGWHHPTPRGKGVNPAFGQLKHQVLIYFLR